MVNNRLVEFRPHTVSSRSNTPPAYASSLPTIPVTRQRASTFATNFSFQTPPHSPSLNSQSQRAPSLNTQSQRVAAQIYPSPNPDPDSEYNWQSELL